MKEILKISMLSNGEKIAHCRNIVMEQCSATTARKFTFENVIILSQGLEIEHKSELTVITAIHDKFGNEKELFHFDILLFDFGELLHGQDWWAYGLVTHDYPEPYNQYVVDIFNEWQNGNRVQYSGEKLNFDFKRSLIDACREWGGLPRQITNKTARVDMSFVVDETDLCYLIGKEFNDERSYFGFNLHGFKDCLIDLYNDKKLNDVVVKLVNVDSVDEKEIRGVYNEFKGVLTDFGIDVVEIS